MFGQIEANSFICPPLILFNPNHAVVLCCSSSPDLSDTLLPMQPSDVLDMPVDPNEPTYCLCHQVSYGEMIGCDNPDVGSHWFLC